MNRVLESIDIFAPSVEFTFKEKRHHGTALGGFFSFLTIFIISYYSASSIAEIFQSEHYTVAQSQKAQNVG